MNEPEERDPALSRIYRQATGGEPSPALDAAILAAARGAAAKPLRRPRWWQRLVAPVALAVTVVMAVMLSVTVDRQPEAPEVRISRDVPAEQAPAPVELRELQTARPAAKTESAPAPRARMEAKKAVSEPMPHRLPEQAPAVAGSAAEAMAPPPAAAPPAAAPVATPAQREPAPARAEEAIGANRDDLRRFESRKIAPAAGAVAPAAPSAQSTMPALAWLDEIRSLRRAGRMEEAARSLAQFRAAYPDYPLPEDLR